MQGRRSMAGQFSRKRSISNGGRADPGGTSFAWARSRAGTALGLLPGLLLMSTVGHQIFRFIVAPSPDGLLMLAGAAHRRAQRRRMPRHRAILCTVSMRDRRRPAFHLSLRQPQQQR